MQVIEQEGCIVCTNCGVMHRTSIREHSFADMGIVSGEGGTKKRKIEPEAARDIQRANQKICKESDPYEVKLKELIQDLGHKLEVSEQVLQQALVFAASIPRNKREQESVASACLYLACKELAQSRTLREICAATGAVYSKVSKLVLKHGQGTKPQSFKHHLDRFLGSLQLPFSYAEEALKLQSDKQLQGAPATVAAIVIYKVWAAKAPGAADIAKVALACGVSPAYLRERVAEK
ncbi:hypothetical protein GUITHDRAFT_135112 [Guillardia theta CCMP2712]|uniref:Transcription factor TFIIB cyclin-like domain-containing protein n=1 Tax=Guillardia theta (strain CCMP2712) TaxID=905079 RepID=L1JPQ4_GUITC|nr:hypothetical protein GUITHDRAFT_135112 [Guillardia theta CCMP2712]EKX50427.1 hypothetical protein GUITHDRAFT_135112 [Guillardia theta CCMP2712]|eukprot:XP_005837407.1 hypothetical protein GUITHDRAFT_135112 [Guillardia theta CCMP2712]